MFAEDLLFESKKVKSFFFDFNKVAILLISKSFFILILGNKDFIRQSFFKEFIRFH